MGGKSDPWRYIFIAGNEAAVIGEAQADVYSPFNKASQALNIYPSPIHTSISFQSSRINEARYPSSTDRILQNASQ